MATSFGDGEGTPDLRRLATNPVVLGAALVAVLVGIFVWKKTANPATAPTGTAVSGQLAGVLPATNNSPDTISTAGLQQDLSNLTAQVSAGFAAQQPGSPNNVQANDFSAPPGEIVLGGTGPVPVWNYDPEHQGILEFLQPGSKLMYQGQGFGFDPAKEPGWIVDIGGLRAFVRGMDVQAVGPPRR